MSRFDGEGWLVRRASRSDGVRRVATAMSPFLRTHLVMMRPKPVEAPVTSSPNERTQGVQRSSGRRRDEYPLNQTLGGAIVEKREGKKSK